MPDQPKSQAKGGKILGMPRTTGFIVLALGAVVVGYVLISHFTGSSKSTGGSKGGPGGGSGGGQYGPGHGSMVVVIRDWQGHRGR